MRGSLTPPPAMAGVCGLVNLLSLSLTRRNIIIHALTSPLATAGVSGVRHDLLSSRSAARSALVHLRIIMTVMSYSCGNMTMGSTIAILVAPSAVTLVSSPGAIPSGNMSISSFDIHIPPRVIVLEISYKESPKNNRDSF